jgi:hypothetical protein
MLSVEHPTAKFLTRCRRANDPPLSILKSLKLLQYIRSYCIAMASKKRVVLNLNAKVKTVEASEKDKPTTKQIVGIFKVGITQV